MAVVRGIETPESACWAEGRSMFEIAAESPVTSGMEDVCASCVSAKTRSRRSW